MTPLVYTYIALADRSVPFVAMPGDDRRLGIDGSMVIKRQKLWVKLINSTVSISQADSPCRLICEGERSAVPLLSG